MKSLSLKMDEKIYQETERILLRVRKNRNRYINEAVKFYDLLQKNKLAKQLQKESKQVRAESMKIIAEFEKSGYKD